MGMNRKIWLGLGIFGFFFLLGILLFAGYMYKYQQLVNEGSALAEERCLVINPIIAKKQFAAMQYAEVFSSTASAEVKTSVTENMLKYFKNNITTSDSWMKKQKHFLGRWDFKFFTDDKLADVSYAQYGKYLADLDSNRAMIEYFDKFEDPWYYEEVLRKIKAQDDTQKILNKKIKIAQNRFDIRYYFIKVPLSKCKEIPNPFDWHDNSFGVKDSLG